MESIPTRIRLERPPYNTNAIPDRAFTFELNPEGNVRSLSEALTNLTTACRDARVRDAHVVGCHFEDEAPALYTWKWQNGQLDTLTIHCETEGDLACYDSAADEVVDPPPAPPTPVKTAPQSALAYGNPPPLHQPEIPRPGDEPNPMLINKRDVSQGEWAQLRNNVVANIEDLNYLNEWAYAGIRLPDAATLMGFLQGDYCQCWLIRAETESGPQMVGFINYGNVIPHHRYAFGLVVGRRFARRGYGMRAMVEFITRREEFGIGELHGYCNRNNASIVNLMRRMNVGGMGFVQDNGFDDRYDGQAIHFAFQRLP